MVAGPSAAMVLSGCAALAARPEEQARPLPHIVFLLVDDFGWADAVRNCSRAPPLDLSAAISR